MDTAQNPLFPAKLLLFGEYSIVIGGQGLTVPYTAYGGSLQFARTNVLNRSGEIRQSNDTLRRFAQYLVSVQQSGKLPAVMDIEQMQTDVQQGLYFDSNIPHGYGLGSSGALCAAVYYRYALHGVDTVTGSASADTIIRLRSIFAQMEAFFHGASSGIDPLVCYLQQPLHILGENSLHVVNMPETPLQILHLFLYETGKPRPANSGLVPLFLKKMENPEFADICRLYLNKYNNNCIQAFLHSDATTLWENFRRLSQFQLVHFEPMIPGFMLQQWRRGLNRRQFYLKLCGAGGGGYMLGLCKNLPETIERLGENGVHELAL